ncbi:MAG TPA: pyridoxal kinase PdxY [Stellaceae bacterium]|nr:pyridoxal kinase PdxY [Stellaceae bacterium]
MRSILSIQSWVSYGHVGNAAAVFPLQRLGFEVWAVNTVQFSNHPGYGQWRGRVLEAAAVVELIQGIGERGVLPDCSAVLSGYMGDAALGEAILGAVDAVKAANPRALYCCDPVMGDVDRGFFVRPGIPEFFRDRAVPAADIVTPNQFELEYLTGRPIDSLAGALDAVAAVLAMGPRRLLLTSLRRADGPTDAIEMLAADETGTWLVSTPLLPISVNGAGDAVAALFLAHLLKTDDTATALAEAAAAIHAVLAETNARQAREIQLIAAQDELVAPKRRFDVRRVR